MWPHTSQFLLTDVPSVEENIVHMGWRDEGARA
jgi:hypothetical protein